VNKIETIKIVGLEAFPFLNSHRLAKAIRMSTKITQFVVRL